MKKTNIPSNSQILKAESTSLNENSTLDLSPSKFGDINIESDIYVKSEIDKIVSFFLSSFECKDLVIRNIDGYSATENDYSGANNIEAYSYLFSPKEYHFRTVPMSNFSRINSVQLSSISIRKRVKRSEIVDSMYGKTFYCNIFKVGEEISSVFSNIEEYPNRISQFHLGGSLAVNTSSDFIAQSNPLTITSDIEGTNDQKIIDALYSTDYKSAKTMDFIFDEPITLEYDSLYAISLSRNQNIHYMYIGNNEDDRNVFGTIVDGSNDSFYITTQEENFNNFKKIYCADDDLLLFQFDTSSMTTEFNGITEYMKSNSLVIPSIVNTNDVPYKVTSIGDSALKNCNQLTNITIPNTVSSIGCYAFDNCNSITNLIIPDTVESIGDGAFVNCANILNVSIPPCVTKLSETFPNSYSSITNVVMADGITSIESNAFANCTSLTNIIIPDTVKSIGNNAFRTCSSLIDINIPNGVSSIGDCTFDQCKSLTSLIIPNGVESIGEWGIGGCTNLISVIIGDGITSIRDNAFNWCESLNTVIFTGDTPPQFGSNVFSNTDSNLTIYVNNNSEDKWSTALNGYNVVVDEKIITDSKKLITNNKELITNNDKETEDVIYVFNKLKCLNNIPYVKLGCTEISLNQLNKYLVSKDVVTNPSIKPVKFTHK